MKTDKIKSLAEKSDRIYDLCKRVSHISFEKSFTFQNIVINTPFSLIEIKGEDYPEFKEVIITILKSEFGEENINHESIAIVALFHDVCKCCTYKVEMRNVKENGEWVQKPYYVIDDQLPYGHGEKSVYMISGFMKLTREEALAINWHMGGFDSRVLGGFYGLSNVFLNYPTSVLFHISDIEATYLDEEINSK